MSFLDQARERARALGQQARTAVAQGGSGEAEHPDASSVTDARSSPTRATGSPTVMQQLVPRDVLQRGLHGARAGMAAIVERLDPGVLADVVIKATTVQERANEALRAKKSAYRIAGISVTATIPPQISFSISRVGDVPPVVGASR